MSGLNPASALALPGRPTRHWSGPLKIAAAQPQAVRRTENRQRRGGFVDQETQLDEAIVSILKSCQLNRDYQDEQRDLQPHLENIIADERCFHSVASLLQF